MGKQRGTYKRYNWNDSVSTPKTTHYRRLKDKNKNPDSFIELRSFSSSNNNLQNQTTESSNLIISPSHAEDSLSNSIHTSINPIESVDQNIIEEINKLNDERIASNIESVHLDDAPLIDFDTIFNNVADDDDNNFDTEMNSFFTNGEILKEDLAAAYLAAFYSGKTSQTSLTDYLKLSNIYSQIKLPTTFDGLKNLVQGKSCDFQYDKTWFCGICLKSFKSLSTRFQRSCNVCKTRYI